MRNQYIKTLHELTRKDDRIYALISDNGTIVYDKYKEEFPDHLINIGIAEANMVSIAAGLASCGKIPFAYTIATFLSMRAFEQIRNNVCLQRMNVKLVGIGCGFAYSNLGPTHHSLEDLALMRSLPSMTVFSPCDALEVDYITRAAVEIDGPVYIRLATGGTPKVHEGPYDFQVGKPVTMRKGNDLTLISTGLLLLESLKAADLLEEKGISTRVLNVHTVKPLDREDILKAATQTQGIVTIEDHTVYGGLGGAVCEVVAQCYDKTAPVKCLGMDNTFGTEYGTHDDLKEAYGISAGQIAEQALTLISNRV